MSAMYNHNQDRTPIDSSAKMPGRAQEVPKHIEMAEAMSRDISNFSHDEIYQVVDTIRTKVRAELERRAISLDEHIEKSRYELEQLKKLMESI